MKHLLIGAVVLASAAAPAASNASDRHHDSYYSSNVQSVRDAYGMATPPSYGLSKAAICSDPNVVTVEQCRASSNGQ